jgi:hypothetical protein
MAATHDIEPEFTNEVVDLAAHLAGGAFAQFVGGLAVGAGALDEGAPGGGFANIVGPGGFQAAQLDEFGVEANLLGGDVTQPLSVAVDTNFQLGPGLVKLFAVTESGEVLLAEFVFEAKQLFAEAFQSVAGLGKFGEVGGAA